MKHWLPQDSPPSMQVFSAGVQIQAGTDSVPRVQLRPPGGARRPRRSREIRGHFPDPAARTFVAGTPLRSRSPAGASRPQGRPQPFLRSGRPGVPTTNPLPTPPRTSGGKRESLSLCLLVSRMVRAGAQPQRVRLAPRCPQDPAPDPLPRGPTASYGHCLGGVTQ